MLTVPSIINGNKVNAIGTGTRVFDYEHNEFIGITLPESIESIGASAFRGCFNLKSIQIPSKVKAIEEDTFFDCDSLKDIILPQNLKSIGATAFWHCDVLMTISIPDSVVEIGARAFKECVNLTEIIIPSEATAIGDYAFADCTKLKAVTLKENVKTIGNCAFSGCSELSTVVLPYGLKEIGYCAFDGCVKLTAIELPNSVETIGFNAFSGCVSLVRVTIPKSVYYMDIDIFYGCPASLVIYCEYESTAYNYAIAKSISVIVLKASSTVVLQNKVATYCGGPIEIDKAQVTGSKGTLSYVYYTDAPCTKKTTVSHGASDTGKAPSYAGTYYVRATLEADNYCKGADSNVATLVIIKAESSISLTNKSATYKGKTISVGKAKVEGSTGTVKYIYYTDAYCTKKTSKSNGAAGTGKAPKYAGTYYVRAAVLADMNYDKAYSNVAKLVIKKAKATIQLKTTSKSYKLVNVKKKSQNFLVGATVSSKTKMSYKKLSGSKVLSINKKTGRIILKKGTKKGTYRMKIRVSSASSKNYLSSTKDVTITVKVK